MKYLLVLLFALVALIQVASSQNTTTTTPSQTDLDFAESELTPPTSVDIGTNLLTTILTSAPVQHGLHKLVNFVDLKIRIIKFIVSILTRENFVLLRRTLELVVRVCNFFIQYLPEDDPNAPQQGIGSFLSGFVPIILGVGVPGDFGDNIMEVPVSGTSPNEIVTAGTARIDRSASLSQEEKDLLKGHEDDVLQVARLIYHAKK